jgi:CHAT domain-containing protein
MPIRRIPIGAGIRRSAVWPIALGVALGAVVASDPPRSFGERIGPLRPGPGRLVGVPYAPEGTPQTEAQRLALVAEVHRLPGADDPEHRTPETLRKNAILKLAQGDADSAVQLLERALERLPADHPAHQEAVLRSDLSAAHLQRFAQGDSPISSLAALDEAGRAVELAPESSPAEENLAAILKRLGLARWLPMRPAPAAGISKRRILDLASAIGHGDLDALKTLPVPEELLGGVRRYREGLELRQIPALEPAAFAFADASKQFSAAGSPFVHWAEYRRAEVGYQAGEYPEALERLTPLAVSTDPLLAGRSIWLIGTIHTQKGELSAAAHDFSLANDKLVVAGEKELSACAFDLLAENLRLRDLARSAWSWNLAALAALDSVADPQRQRQILSGAGATAAARGRFGAARLLEAASYAAVEAGGAAVSPATRTHASRLQADLALQGGDLRVARDSWQEAMDRLVEIPDDAVRQPIEGDLLLLGARIVFVLGRVPDPATTARALHLLFRAEAGDGFRALPQRRIELWAQGARLLALAGRAEEAEVMLGRVEKLAETSRIQLSASRTSGVRAAYADLAASRLRSGDSIRAFEALARAQCWRTGEVVRCADLTFDSWVRSLPSNVLAVVAWPMDSELVLLAVRRGAAPIGVLLSMGRGELARLAERFREHPEDPLLGTHLSRVLLGPIEPLLHPGDRLFASLEGVLGTLPLAALPTASGRYLVEEHDLAFVRRIAAVPALAAPWKNDTAAWRSVIVGASQGGGGFFPLPEAKEEAERVASAFPGAAVLTGEAAQKTPILAELTGAVLFHFAGHASLLRGGLVLGEDATRGIDVLSAEDLAPRARNLRLAVLSACRTGKTEGIDAELDLSRALLDAGVPAVIATTAPVDDDKALALFERFYPQLRASGDPLQALRASQLAMLRGGDKELRSPDSWAPFVVWVDRLDEDRRTGGV